MKNRVFQVLLAGVFTFSLLFPPMIEAAKPRVLFDDGHGQRAGNADWVINGGFSDFADVFKRLGCEVRPTSRLSDSELQGVDVLVLPEPNSPYLPDEEAAIVNFVNNGGGLYAIGDHDKSDRNGDGVDSVGVLNRFLPKLGLQLNKLYFSEAPIAGEYKDTPLTKGVRAVGIWGGTSVKCLSSSSVAHILVSVKNGNEAFIATSEVGNGGRVVAMGDSSPYDDGTGDPKDKLHNGFSNPKYQHDVLARNSVQWLLSKKQPTPRNRLNYLMTDLRVTQKALSQKTSEEILGLAENTEKNLVRLLQENPDLLQEFKSSVPSQAGVRNVLKNLEAIKSFSQVHGD